MTLCHKYYYYSHFKGKGTERLSKVILSQEVVEPGYEPTQSDFRVCISKTGLFAFSYSWYSKLRKNIEIHCGEDLYRVRSEEVRVNSDKTLTCRLLAGEEADRNSLFRMGEERPGKTMWSIVSIPQRCQVTETFAACEKQEVINSPSKGHFRRVLG